MPRGKRPMSTLSAGRVTPHCMNACAVEACTGVKVWSTSDEPRTTFSGRGKGPTLALGLDFQPSLPHVCLKNCTTSGIALQSHPHTELHQWPTKMGGNSREGTHSSI